MLADLIRLLLTLACGMLALSLPIARTAAGAALRRIAGVSFVLALLPSLLAGLFSAGASNAQQPSPSSMLSSFGCIAAILVVPLLAFGILRLRARLRAKATSRDPWEALFGRGAGKRPFHRVRSSRRIRVRDDEDDD